MIEIKSEHSKRVKNLDDLQNILSINTYLNEIRKEIDKKYVYRCSVLIMVFARLVSEGFIEEKDLKGLSGDKL